MSLVNGQYAVPFPIVQKLSDTGFETLGVLTNFIGDYSSVSQDAFYTAPPGQIHELTALNISVTDSGAFAPQDWGNIVGGLPNGLLIIIETDGFELFEPAQVIPTNVDLFGIDSSAQIIEYGSNLRTIIARFDFSTPIVLNGDTEDKFIIRLSDDMSALQRQEFIVSARG